MYGVECGGKYVESGFELILLVQLDCFEIEKESDSLLTTFLASVMTFSQRLSPHFSLK